MVGIIGSWVGIFDYLPDSGSYIFNKDNGKDKQDNKQEIATNHIISVFKDLRLWEEDSYFVVLVISQASIPKPVITLS